MSLAMSTSKYLDHAYDEFERFAEEFKNESDRAAVILGAAKIDLQLCQLLQAVLRPSTSRNDELLDGDSPLSTFSSRIALTHRLGLIDDEFCRALNLIRKIRNSFAHELGEVSLTSGAHRDRILNLCAPLKKSSGFEFVINNFFGGKADAASQFRAAVAIAAIRLVSHYTRGASALYQELAFSFNAWQPKNAVFIDSPRMLNLYFGLSGLPQLDYFRNLRHDGAKRKAEFVASGQHLIWRRGPNGFEGPFLSLDERIIGGY